MKGVIMGNEPWKYQQNLVQGIGGYSCKGSLDNRETSVSM